MLRNDRVPLSGTEEVQDVGAIDSRPRTIADRPAGYRKRRRSKPRKATTVEPPLSRKRFYLTALQLPDDLVPEKYHDAFGKLIDELISGIPHPKDESFTQIPSTFWRSYFPSTIQRRLKSELVETEESYWAGRYSKGYRLKAEYQQRLERAEREYLPRTDGEPRLPVAHENKGGCKPKFLDMPCYLDIDRDAARRMIPEVNAAITVIESGSWDVSGVLQSQGEINNLREKYSDNHMQVIGYLHKCLSVIHTVLDLSMNPNSNMQLEQCFRHSDSSRWMGVGSGNLQNSRKLARRILLANHYSYDISSSTHSVMLELYEQQTGDRLPHLRNYVKNKSEIRQQLADEIGVPVTAIKGALIAAIRGAPQTGDAMRGYLGDSLESLLRLRQWRVLDGDMRKAFSLSYKSAEKTSDRRAYVNAAGDRKSIRSKGRRLSAPQIVSHVYTGYEAEALAAMRMAAWESNPVLCLHDCLVCRDRVDIDSLESAILERTGLPLKIEEERYPDWN